MSSPDECGAAYAVELRRSGMGGRDGPCTDAGNRGAGCSQPSRSAVGLVHAVLLGLRLVAEDEELQEAIRRELKKAVGSGAGEPRRGRGKPSGIGDPDERRRKPLELYYADKLSAELFAEEEARLSGQIQVVRREQEESQVERSRLSDMAAKFEEVARTLRDMDVERLGPRPPTSSAASSLRSCWSPSPLPGSPRGRGERRATAERHSRGGRTDWGSQFRGVGGGI
jgi:hypothetical protein